MGPLHALLALHGLWILLIVPLTFLLIRISPPIKLLPLGIVLTTIGLLGLGIVAGREMMTWWPTVAAADRIYIGHRVLFVLFADLDEVPILQVTLAGIACWLAASRRLRPGRCGNSAVVSVLKDGKRINEDS